MVIRAVVFDLDDTLYPEVEFVHGGYQAVAEAVRQQHGIEIYEELAELFEGGQRGDLFTPVLRKHLRNVEETYVKTLVEIYRKHEPALHSFPEVESTLRKLKASYRLAIISDGILAVQERKLTALGLRHYFDVVIFTGQWGREAWKPNTRSYDFVLGSINISGPESVYVGDNPTKDFYGARIAGMHTIRVRRPDGLYRQFEPPAQDYAPDVEIESLKELDGAVHRLSQAPSPTVRTGPH